ncbi:MAG: hypothetical protein H6733_01480 [Alphaproteobacteria bacterium]|nr:hypothetical protein [Alphaproteobacteria bacterium]
MIRSSLILGAVAPLALIGCTGSLCDDTAGSVCTVAGVPQVAQFSAEGLKADEAELYLPQDMTVGPDGLLYIVDFNNHRLRRIVEDGTVETIAGTGFLGDGPEGPADLFAFNHPTNIAFDPLDDTKLYIAAWHNSRVNVLDLETGELDFEAGTGGRSFGGDGGPARDAVLDLPAGIAFAQDGTLYVSDQANQLIRRIKTDQTIDTVAGRQRDQGYSGDGGPALDAQFHAAVGQEADPSSRLNLHDGVLYLADTSNHVIRTIDTSTWMVGTFAGKGEQPGFSGDGGAATDALMRNPRDVEIADDGTVYVADTDNFCVRRIDTSGVITTVAGQCGQFGYGGDGGAATDALFGKIYGIELTPDASMLYIADTSNHIIRRVNL